VSSATMDKTRMKKYMACDSIVLCRIRPVMRKTEDLDDIIKALAIL